MKCFFTIFIFLIMSVSYAQVKSDVWLENLIRKEASPLLQSVLNQPDTFRYQIIYTKIDRDKKNKPNFKNYYLHVDRALYFYPASMVKLPVALASLEMLNSQKLPVNKFSFMLIDSTRPWQTAVINDKSSATGLPSVDHYIKKIFLVSDNDAYNRLYQFVGQKQLNEMLWKRGYTQSRITRRFDKSDFEQNRYTNQIRFFDSGRLIYTQPEAYSDLKFDFSRKILMGNAHYDKDENLVNKPYDFTMHNAMPLEDMQLMMQSVLFPKSAATKRRFNLTKEDYRSLYQYMSERPSESHYPKYDTGEYFDSYTKFFFFRDGKRSIPEYIRSFNKTGWSHGFLTDVCYIVDFKNKVEFMLSGSIYTNSDGVLNDNKYEYNEIGYPFFREVGEIIYNYELNRKRRKPDLSEWVLRYH
ncbi:MAG: serine hydrolase [Sphingobacteriales bacterium]|nr:serine hydrolase [Sphingobacteriales bacterium]